MNILDPILFHCTHDPEAPAICVPGVDLTTYGQLRKYTNNVIRRAITAGLTRGKTAALFIPNNPVLHAALILGLARLGVITVSAGALNKLPSGLHIDAILSETAHPSSYIQTIIVNTSWLEGDGIPAAIDHVPQGDDICRIILTSGTTGEPKSVALTHNMILGRILRYDIVFGSKIPSCMSFFCDPSFATAIGNAFLLYTLCKGGFFVSRGNNAENTLRAFRFYKVQGMVAAPAGLTEFAGYYDQYAWHHNFDSILTIGSMLSPQLAEHVQARMGSSLISSYGSTEVGIVASAPASSIGHIKGAVGYVVPGMSVEIVDETSRKCAPGEEGIVRISGEHVVKGYLGETGNSQEYFRDGWFYPGDTGRLADNRLLIVSGRQKSILNVGGEKVKPEIIEEVLSMAGVTAGIFLVTSPIGADEIWAAIESSRPVDENAIRIHCQKSLPHVFMPKRFIIIEKLPRNDMGKLDRMRLNEIGKAR